MLSGGEDELGNEAFELEGRELCPDGACLGLIGPDGRCKVCGTPSPDGPPEPGRSSEVDGRPASRGADAQGAAPPEGEAGGGDPEADEGFDPLQRELCPDGACLGVIGPDGRCNLCGRAAQEGMPDP